MPSSDPSASPSGFSCVASSSLSAWRSSSTTWSSSVATLTGRSAGLLEQLAMRMPGVDRLVVDELEHRCALHPQLVAHLGLQESVRGTETIECLFPLVLVAEHADVTLARCAGRGWSRRRSLSRNQCADPSGLAAMCAERTSLTASFTRRILVAGILAKYLLGRETSLSRKRTPSGNRDSTDTARACRRRVQKRPRISPYE